MEQEPPRKPNIENLEAEFDRLETAILELISHIYESPSESIRQKVADLEKRHLELEQQLSAGSINLKKAVVGCRKILVELQALTS